MNKTSARILAVGLPLVAVVATGASFAYWTGGGTGSASSAAAAAVSDVTLSATTVTGLVPGGSVVVPVTATNPNATTSVSIATLTAGAVTSDLLGCTAVISGATAVATSPTAAVVVPPNNGTASFGSVTVKMVNSPTVDQDACKGATFTVALSAA